MTRKLSLTMAFCLLLFLLEGAMGSEGIDLTGSWQSFYEYGSVEESIPHPAGGFSFVKHFYVDTIS